MAPEAIENARYMHRDGGRASQRCRGHALRDAFLFLAVKIRREGHEETRSG